MGNLCVLCGRMFTRGNNQYICGHCRKDKRIKKEREKAKRLIRRVCKYDKFLISKRVSSSFRKKLWKTFKPLFPKDYQKKLKQKGF